MILTLSAPNAEILRVATYNVELTRDGPGLLLQDILKDQDDQVSAVAHLIAAVAPDILLLQNIDYDHGLVALNALRDRVARDGPNYAFSFALPPNTGRSTGLDMDGDGRAGQARDKQGFGYFAGQGGMAMLSRFPVETQMVRDFSDLLWKDLPAADMPTVDHAPFPSAEAAEIQRLATVGQWVVPVRVGDVRVRILAFHASPPVFDGPEDRNGLRNRDELRFWPLFLDGRFGPAPAKKFVLAGAANQDPVDGEGRKAGIIGLLTDPRLQDPKPKRSGEVALQPEQRGTPALDTVFWPAPGPGALRVDYVLPSADLKVVASGVYWPDERSPEGQIVSAASRHRIVWVDVVIE